MMSHEFVIKMIKSLLTFFRASELNIVKNFIYHQIQHFTYLNFLRYRGIMK